MMHQTFEAHYGEADGVQVLEIPYNNGRWSFVLVLPGEVDGLAKLEKTLNAAWLNARLAALGNRETHLILPRFRISAEFRLPEPLTALGARTLFSEREADLRGISSKEPLF